ncbi:MAG: polyribonucleotide nucleotidyltransferase [Deltaproteobacteria bacterium]|nr:polyribonucleotide nucleotidyltransferase [Deltaproteobacteria bacterium]
MAEGISVQKDHNSKQHASTSLRLGNAVFAFDTGRVAKQTAGSVWVQYGDTVVLVTAVQAKPREGIDFFPLTVEYQEKMYAAGKIPGGFFKREARPRDAETLNARITDRSIRPLFPEGFKNDTQVICTVMSHDGDHDSDMMALNGASCALHISDIPWADKTGPIAGVRVGRKPDGSFILNPTPAEKAASDLDLFVAAHKDAIVMVEGGAAELAEDILIEALLFAHRSCLPIIAAMEDLRKKIGKPKVPYAPAVIPEDIKKAVADEANTLGLKDAFRIKEKLARYAKRHEIHAAIKEKLKDRFVDKAKAVDEAFHELEYTMMRALVLDDSRRLDGRTFTEIRPIAVEVGVLPRAHGSAIFTRGETQAVVSCTLGTKDDEQKMDTLLGQSWKKFMMHYNFPPYSVGEVRMLRGSSRREIGHGALAERAVERIAPKDNPEFPYTVRVVSEITESNGSSSMASVCGGTLALMDAGVPIKAPAAGIAMGLIKEGNKVAVLSDILGDEDHLGDMDFKVCGTETGITAVQMDIKIDGMSRELLEKALYQARDGRKHILSKMTEVIGKPRADLSKYAPRITMIRINPDKIKDVIGPGGKTIRDIVEKTKAKIDINDDGSISIASVDGEGVKRAIQIIQDITQEAEIGKIYMGTVRKVAEFGAFVQIFPGTDGLVHISELADKRVAKVTDVLQEGDEVAVKVLAVEPGTGKIKLSRKQAVGHKVGDVVKG